MVVGRSRYSHGVRLLRGTVLLLLAALSSAAMWARVDHVRADRAWAAQRRAWVPGPRGADEYAGSDACRGCHLAAYDSWHGSYHRTMTQHAGPDTILAPWQGELPGGVSLRWQGSRPEIVRDGADGVPRAVPVVMTTGSHHMQIFWTPDGATGAVRAFEFAWLVDAGRFVPNAATLLRPDGDDAVYTWNRICIRCHAVAGDPGWREGTGVVDSRVVELGIACEACHGAARDHVEHHRNPLARYLAHGAGVPADVVQPRAMTGDRASQVCAQCHAITEFDDERDWLAHGSDHAVDDPIAAWGRLVRHPARSDAAWIDEVLAGDPNFLVDRWWSDGMVRVTGREYNALVESPCAAHEALSCLSCHSLHDGTRDDQLRAGMDGDGACTQCHDPGAYASAEHTHHAAAGEGARCMNCHMPRTTWGLLGAIRSHQVDSPDVAVWAETGRPLACNLCHLDRSVAWTDAWLRTWRGDPVAIPQDDPSAAAVGVLAAEAGVRALWAWHLAWPAATSIAGSTWQLELLAAALGDPYPAVRETAWQSIDRLLPDHAVILAPGALAGPHQAERIRAIAATRHADRDGPAVLRLDGVSDSDTIARWIATRDDRRVALAE